MVQHPLGEVRIAGSLLAALMKQVGSQAGTHAEGLLLGAAHKLAVAVTDDNQEATEDTMMQLDLTGYECTGSRDTFYDPVTAAVDKGQLAAATAGVNGGNKRGEHHVLGWFVARRAVSTKPSLRDLAILRCLRDYLRQQHQQQGGGGVEESKESGRGSKQPPPQQPQPYPVVLVVFSLDIQPSQDTQGFSYACHYLPDPPTPDLAFFSLMLKVRNVSHDSTSEYAHYTGGYHSSLRSAAMPPMHAGLAALTTAVPAPHVAEAECYMDQVVAQLHGLVDDIRGEEAGLLALKEKQRRLRDMLEAKDEEDDE